MVIAAIGTVFAMAGYLLWLYQRAAFGTPTAEFADEHIHDVETPEWIAWCRCSCSSSCSVSIPT